MSQLSNKILSFNPQTYFRFNQAYSLSPQNSGSTGVSPNWSNSNEAAIANPTGGIHGEGSLRILCGNGVSDTSITRYYKFENNTTPTNINAPYVDNDYTAGFWFKTNFTLSTSGVHPTNYTISQLGGSPVGKVNNITLSGSSANAANKGKLTINLPGNLVVISPNRVDDQKWHFCAVRVFANGSNFEHHYYLDGTLIGTRTYTGYTTGLVYSQFGTSTITTAANHFEATSFEVSDYFITPSSVIGPTQIEEIWLAGTSTRTVKYFNGTSWVDSIGQKVWNGTAWVDWNAKRFDGSAWVNV
jgi:hypothetical protein